MVDVQVTSAVRSRNHQDRRLPPEAAVPCSGYPQVSAKNELP